MTMKLVFPEGIVKEEEDEKYGRFVFKPLERGFGTTIGNSIRRVLLSSIEGAAIYAVRIDGVLHEFTSIDGVFEDVPEIVLNLKKIRVRFLIPDEKKATFTLEHHGKGLVKAGDIHTPEYTEIINPEQEIANITDDNARISMELLVNRGFGYVRTEEMYNVEVPERFFLIDAIYSPVTKVNYKVENFRVKSRTDYEKLIIEVWTDGTIRPENAIKKTAGLLKEHCERLLTFVQPKVEKEEDIIKFEERERMRNILLNKIEFLELSRRTINCLRNAGITRIYQLISKTGEELLEVKNFGQKSLSEINEKLDKFGFTLGIDIYKYFDKEELDEASKQN